MAASSARTKVFISYSHQDEKHLQRLHVYLKQHQIASGLPFWDDTKIEVGSDWFEKIMAAIASASVAVLLISEDFLASDFINEHELPPLLEATRQNKLTLIQIILSPCAFDDRPDLKRFQTVNPPSKPLIGLPEVEQRALWNEVARQVSKALTQPKPPELLPAFQWLGSAPPPPATVALPTLMIFSITGNIPPRRVPVQAGGMTIGREHTSTLSLTEASVSRHHLQLSPQGTQWEVTRLPNAGPLYINGHPRDQAILQPHDQLVIGGMVLRFESTDPRLAISNIGTEQMPLLITSEQVPHLTVTWAGGRFVVPLREQTITLGRTPDCGIIVPSDIVGGRHARLDRMGDGSYHIADLFSRNGLLFQGALIKERYLQHGDRLLIGAPDTGQLVMLAYALPR